MDRMKACETETFTLDWTVCMKHMVFILLECDCGTLLVTWHF